MTAVSIPDAAERLGVSIDTVRRRVRRGELLAERNTRGHWRVMFPDDVPMPAYGDDSTIHTHAYATQDDQPMHEVSSVQMDASLSDRAASASPIKSDRASAEIERDFLHTRGLLAEVQRQRDQLETQVAALNAQAERADMERAELRRLLAQSMLALPPHTSVAHQPSGMDNTAAPRSAGTRADESFIPVTNDVQRGGQEAPRRSWWRVLLGLENAGVMEGHARDVGVHSPADHV